MIKNRNWKHPVRIAALLIPTLFFVPACEEQGPAEEAGETIDESMESMRENVEEAGDKIEEKTDEMQDSMN